MTFFPLKVKVRTTVWKSTISEHLLGSTLPEPDKYLATYTFSAFNQQSQPQKNEAQVLL
jgi:hypothetical protein